VRIALDFIFTAWCTIVQSTVLRSHVVCPSVRPSVCLSVTLVDHDYIGWKSSKLIGRTISPTSLLFVAERLSTYSQGNMEKFWGENILSTPTSILHNVRLNWVNRESRDLRWSCGCLFTFVGASRGRLCDSTAFLYFFTTSQENGQEERVRRDIVCVEWDEKRQLNRSGR